MWILTNLWWQDSQAVTLNMQLTQSTEITNFFGQLHQVILTKHQLQKQYSTLLCLVFIKEIL
jgi:hypothetical protein